MANDRAYSANSDGEPIDVSNPPMGGSAVTTPTERSENIIVVPCSDKTAAWIKQNPDAFKRIMEQCFVDELAKVGAI